MAADYTKRELRAQLMREQLASERGERFTIFSVLPLLIPEAVAAFYFGEGS